MSHYKRPSAGQKKKDPLGSEIFSQKRDAYLRGDWTLANAVWRATSRRRLYQPRPLALTAL
jgi:hypothetical protein